MQYAQDYDERACPQNIPTPGATWGNRYWAYSVLIPYIKNTGVWECPSYESPHVGTCEQRMRLGIGYNWAWTPIEGEGGDRGWLQIKKLVRIERPAEFCVFGDSNCMGFGPYNNGNWDQWVAGAPYANPGCWPQPASPKFRHMEGINIAFADGHVKFVKPSTLKQNQFCRVSGLPDP